MWYVIQTVAGKEEELLLFMKTILDRELYENCFLIRVEGLKRLGGTWRLQVKPLFPGYIFVETGQTKRLYAELKRVPRFSKLLGDGEADFVPVREAEERFLKAITGLSDSENKDTSAPLVRLTTAEISDDGEILSLNGVLRHFKKDIVSMNLHKRYAIVRTCMLGGERNLQFGIRLKRENLFF